MPATEMMGPSINGRDAKVTLEMLDEEVVLLQDIEDSMYVL